MNCKRQIFQAYPSRNSVMIRDVDELLVMTSHLNRHEKKTVFYAHGADYDRVLKYYMRVKRLNEIYYKKSISAELDLLGYLLLCFWRLVKVFLLMLSDQL